MTDREVLCRTPAGVLSVGQGIWFRRERSPGGWVTATGVSANGLWVYARDSRGLARVIRIEEITKVGKPPPDQPIRDVITKPRRKLGRRR